MSYEQLSTVLETTVNVAYSLLDVLRLQVKNTLPLHNASIVNQNSRVSNLLETYISNYIERAMRYAKTHIFDNLLGDSFNLFPFRNVAFIVSDVIYKRILNNLRSEKSSGVTHSSP